MKILQHYHWHGNVRELEHLMEGILVTMTDKEVKPEHLPVDILMRGLNSDLKKTNGSLKEVRKNIEKKYIELVLKEAGNNHAKAAKLLGVHRYTLMRKMKKLKIL